MIIYICLETILQNPEIIPKIKKLYEDGDTITIACTLNFREKNEREDIEKMLEPLKNCYHKLSFLKPEYDMIIDDKAVQKRQGSIQSLLT